MTNVDICRMELSALKGQTISYMGLAADMLDLGFGIDVFQTLYNGISKKTNEYGLHIQCDWEILPKNAKGLTANNLFSDICEHKQRVLLISSYYAKHFKGTFVTEILLSDNLSFTLFFSNGSSVRIHTCFFEKRENWRFINTVKGYHFCISSDNANGMEYC